MEEPSSKWYLFKESEHLFQQFKSITKGTDKCEQTSCTIDSNEKTKSPEDPTTLLYQALATLNPLREEVENSICLRTGDIHCDQDYATKENFTKVSDKHTKKEFPCD